eukprot:TRINITY_DN1788_c0_g1_i1.p1 TRINITY_DN1788_c0_g1~~TRINITY_DN1788_c0_g1_i1.p1  ORF type:complete len:399 (-),score=101.09 TRINITY_DN1788_c0_g1_i1:13-1209(-)
MFRPLFTNGFKISSSQNQMRCFPLENERNVFYWKDQGHIHRNFRSRIRRSREEKKPEERETLPVRMVNAEGMQELLADDDDLSIQNDPDEHIGTEEGEGDGGALDDTPLEPALYVLSTPIGNHQDLSMRGLSLLFKADTICCEDTRRTIGLLRLHELPKKHLISYHKFSSPEKMQSILDSVKSGQAVALVSNAGTPVISDPGANIISCAHEQNVPIKVFPGPSAVISAVAGSGFSGDRFVFEGFLPKGSKRKQVLRELATLNRTIVFYESPHRIMKCLLDCVDIFGKNHKGAIVRELTKRHESIVRGNLVELLLFCEKNLKGEFTVVLEGKNASKEQLKEEDEDEEGEEEEEDMVLTKPKRRTKKQRKLIRRAQKQQRQEDEDEHDEDEDDDEEGDTK